jgi:4-amino-4-deoxy-L-arabinose transferase-like glycosyltransferase
VQVPLGTATVWLGWRLAYRIAGRRTAIAAAFLLALYPLAFQYEELLYAESLATPLTLLAALLVLTGEPTRPRSVLAGLTIGATLLIRPGSLPLLVMVLIALVAYRGWRLALRRGGVAIACATLVVVPWTVRNAVVEHGFLPIAIDDAAAYGTFNRQAADDPVYPFAWRPDPPSAHAVLHPAHPLSDIELHTRLQRLAIDYIKARPGSVVEAFFWNGLSRLWDVRRRSRALIEVPFEGRDGMVARLGLDAYYLVLPLALLGLWRIRRNRRVLAGLLALAAASSVVYTADSGTRYRAPLEPLLAIMACVGVLGAREGDYPAAMRV